MPIYVITLLSVLNGISLRGSRVLLSLFAIRLGANAFEIGVPLVFGFIGSAFGLIPVFWANAVLLVSGGYLNRKADSKSVGES